MIPHFFDAWLRICHRSILEKHHHALLHFTSFQPSLQLSLSLFLRSTEHCFRESHQKKIISFHRYGSHFTTAMVLAPAMVLGLTLYSQDSCSGGVFHSRRLFRFSHRGVALRGKQKLINVFVVEEKIRGNQTHK